jgi:hypothetical protein
MSIPPSSTPQSKIFLTEWWGHTSNGTPIGGSEYYCFGMGLQGYTGAL